MRSLFFTLSIGVVQLGDEYMCSAPQSQVQYLKYVMIQTIISLPTFKGPLELSFSIYCKNYSLLG
jgi:hypothetical protein